MIDFEAIQADLFAEIDELNAGAMGLSLSQIAERLKELNEAVELIGEQIKADAQKQIEQNRIVESGSKTKLFSEALKDMRPPRWLIKGWLRRGEIAMLYGPSGEYKTFIAGAMACVISCDQISDWYGEIVKHGAVYYSCGEDYDDLLIRLKGWQQTHAADIPADAFKIHIRDGARVLDEAGVQDIEREIDAMETPPVLMIIDTLNRHYDGEENSATDAGKFVRALDALREKYDMAILLIHHSGKEAAKGSRGSTAFKAAVNTEIACSKDKHDFSLVNLDVTKSKRRDGKGHKLTLYMQDVIVDGMLDDDGEPIGTAVPVVPAFSKNTSTDETEEETDTAEVSGGLSNAQYEAYQIFIMAAAETGAFDEQGRFTGLRRDDWQSKYTDIITRYNPAKADNVKTITRTFQRAVSDLTKSGFISTGEKKPTKDSIYRLRGEYAALLENFISTEREGATK